MRPPILTELEITFLQVELGRYSTTLTTTMQYLEDAIKDSELLNVVDETGDYLTTDFGQVVTVARGAAHKFGILHQT